MNRRAFLAAGLALPLVARTGSPQDGRAWRVDGQRLNQTLRRLSRFGSLPGGGVTRGLGTDAYLEARAYVMDLMGDMGLALRIDAAGNIFGRRAGMNPSASPIIFGSHIDTVPHGGDYDGCVGSMAALEVARTLGEQGYRNRHPLEVVIWADEEGGITGSRAFVGQLPAAALEEERIPGRTLGQLLEQLGGRPRDIASEVRVPGSIHAYLELHVEQGGTLHTSSLDIGVVEGIVGIRVFDVVLIGMSNHAGTTPMNARHDALLAASAVVQAVNEVVASRDGAQVGTVGRLEVEPGVSNVIPGRVRMSVELRDLSVPTLDVLWEEIRARIDAVSLEHGVEVNVTPGARAEPALADPEIQGWIRDAAEGMGLGHRDMPSGAGHDAQALASIGPMGMIFVPSVKGISHAPEEFTEPADITNGANVLLRTVLAVDETGEVRESRR